MLINNKTESSLVLTIFIYDIYNGNYLLITAYHIIHYLYYYYCMIYNGIILILITMRKC